ncbi:hypothetical protein [Bradyrhizobium sp. USDA 4502]
MRSQAISISFAFLWFLCGLSPSSISTPSSAAGVMATLGLSAEVGFDEPTRKWLSTLPEQWREPLNKIVEDTLTSVDLHLDNALTKIRDQLRQIEKDAACVWVGANLNTVEVWKSELPFLKKPAPFRELDSYIADERKSALARPK